MKKRQIGKRIPLHKKGGSITSEVTCMISSSCGLLSGAFMVNLYRLTIIDWRLLFFVSVAIGLLLAFTTKKTKYSREILGSSNLFYPFLYYLAAVGTPLCYLFLALNYYLAYPQITYYDAPIKNKSSMPGSKGHRNERQPLVRFDYLGEEKELVFGYLQTSQVEQANKILIRIKKGRLGFEIIESRELLK